MFDKEMGVFEFSGYVTQLAGGSEVADIGIKILCPTGGFAEIHNLLFAVNDLTAAKNVSANLFTKSGQELARIVAALDNQFAIVGSIVLDNKTGVSSDVNGFLMPQIMGDGIYINIHCAATLDATKLLYVRMLYKANAILEFSAIGAGITLTETSNRQI